MDQRLPNAMDHQRTTFNAYNFKFFSNGTLKFFHIPTYYTNGFFFATGVNDTGGASWAANISANFRKNSKRPDKKTA